MTLYIDCGSWSWHQSYMNPFSWRSTDGLIENGAIFCIDSDYSIRKEKLAWYKRARPGNEEKYGLDIQRKKVERYIDFFLRRYDKSCWIREKGLEADDLIGMNVEAGDIVLSQDKDILTIPKSFTIIGPDMIPWGIERFNKKLKKYQLNRGQSFLTYQLLYGDTADEIPRLLFSKDRSTGPFILNQENPLEWAISILPEELVRESLSALILPTPLYFGDDSIEYARWKYK